MCSPCATTLRIRLTSSPAFGSGFGSGLIEIGGTGKIAFATLEDVLLAAVIAGSGVTTGPLSVALASGAGVSTESAALGTSVASA